MDKEQASMHGLLQTLISIIIAVFISDHGEGMRLELLWRN